MKTFYSYSFGCRVNEAEKEEIDRKMCAAGFVFDSKKPDIFIINTCSVTHKAEREARQLIYQTKKKFPKIKIVVTGCSATYWLKNSLYKDLPVHMMIDNVNKEYLVDLIKIRLSKQLKIRSRGVKRVELMRQKVNYSNKYIDSRRIMIKIQDGCQRYCTFCIVPYLRGMPKSQTIKNLELKIKKLEGKISEIILTAINTQAYGYDTNESFVDLLKTIIDNTNIPRISLGSIHPWSLTDEFYRFYQNYQSKKRLVNYFHIPVQSGSNKILNLMKRNYRKEEMQEKLLSINRLNKYALIGTDIIVGFLEETDKDFNETYEFLMNSPISKFHIFRFSVRKKTQANYMAKRLTEPTVLEKEKRAQALIDLGRKKYYQFIIDNIGRKSSVLFLKRFENGYREGLLDNQLPIWIATTGRYITSQEPTAGQITNVKIVEFKKGRLFGKII